MEHQAEQEKVTEKGNNLLSVVLPVFNEELVIKETINRLKTCLEDAHIRHEIIIVNDGSHDRTLEMCISEKKEHDLRIINLSSNSGHMVAISVGLEVSKGSFIATMDADLQDPPKDLISMFKIIEESQSNNTLNKIDVIQAFREDRSSDTYFKRWTASLYYRLIARLTGIEIIHQAADFRIMTRKVVNVLLKLPERNRIYRLLLPKLGFNIYPYPIVREKRFAGVTKYTYRKMIKLTIDSIISFSFKPLRLFSYIGLILSGLYFLAAIVTLLVSIFIPTVPGWPSLILILLGLNTFLFAGFGIIGEYIGRIYDHLQARPIANWYEI